MGGGFRIIGVEEVVIAVKDVDAAAKDFSEMFGFKFQGGWRLDNEKIRIRMEQLGETQLQLMEPTSPDSVVASFLEKRGEGLNHIAFRVEGLDALIKHLKSRGIRLVPEEPVEIIHPYTGERIRYIFIHPKSAHGVLIELIEHVD
ncbi:MAG: VOC family protein [Desulfurococcales archaeon]|nr:VOC family protein [Desulfurococcales archaeon]